MRFGYATSALILSSLLLQGCSSHPLLDTETQNVTEFKLNQAVKVAPNSARTYFQEGESLGSAGFSRYRQHCRLEINTLKDTVQVIQADSFKITSIRTDEEMIAQQTGPVQLAMNSGNDSYNNLLAFIGGENRIKSMDLIHFYLQSDQQPDVVRLTCAGSLSNGNPYDDPHSFRPDKKVINKILGVYGSIE